MHEILDNIDGLNQKMDHIILLFNKDLSGIRTGRASTSLIDSIPVKVHGSNMPLSQIGTISIPNGQSLAVKMWDKTLLQNALKAISDANLGLIPLYKDQIITIKLPTMSEERRKELVKIAVKYGENAKIALRNIRKEEISKIRILEKNGDISKDDSFKACKTIQDVLDNFILKVDKILEAKKQDILVF
ncbi:ribosome recycling factor [Rickettsia endosymbiont of Cardiosporidium cionae]|uniref:ribosome recycling factor n=1 Tax=Rickettsia endosymbiont of Cardiosporidium cionae TaxID=2777155 RepID=UPI001894F0D6|nr:ribosome recycling factor [Rickettsia endosymbiont of Cardiosporidium cionae]KAF8818552.1 ribosome recycling factor [Rickettsia endosymbiont of Cardiosporidium cionae]